MVANWVECSPRSAESTTSSLLSETIIMYGPLASFSVGISEFLERHSKAKSVRAQVYSRALSTGHNCPAPTFDAWSLGTMNA